MIGVNAFWAAERLMCCGVKVLPTGPTINKAKIGGATAIRKPALPAIEEVCLASGEESSPEADTVSGELRRPQSLPSEQQHACTVSGEESTGEREAVPRRLHKLKYDRILLELCNTCTSRFGYAL